MQIRIRYVLSVSRARSGSEIFLSGIPDFGLGPRILPNEKVDKVGSYQIYRYPTFLVEFFDEIGEFFDEFVFLWIREKSILDPDPPIKKGPDPYPKH
jgi:hypothetical protein